MAQIIWTETALVDLNEIAEYIALDKVGAARRLAKKVFESVGELEQFSELGRKPPELENTTYREIIVNPCRIFYRQACRYLVKDFGTSKSPKSTRQRDNH